MRLALRFVVPLVAIITLMAYATIPLFESLDRRWATRDVEVRARLIANTFSEPLTVLIACALAGTQPFQLLSGTCRILALLVAPALQAGALQRLLRAQYGSTRRRSTLGPSTAFTMCPI